ncbi:MAG: Do family serine endopeptidase [Rhodospirillales bacterium]
MIEPPRPEPSFLQTRALPLALAAGLSFVPLLPAPEAAARPAPDSFADLVEQVSPAVVQIASRMDDGPRQQTSAEGKAAPFAGDPFSERSQRDFLERFFGQGRELPQAEGPRIGIGSGFIISADGVIVTNNHVVGDAKRIDVRLRDGREYPAELLGTDPQTDLAVLRIHADEPLSVLSWGNSETTRVGDWVLAVGNPYGLTGTVTAGIVSSRGRDTDATPYVDFLQIDAPLNSGNSGGPLFDNAGHVIGVNTAILTPNGGSVGIGFAIPSEIAQKVVAELQDSGKVERGWLGVAIQPVTPDIAESLGMKAPKGALVATVSAGSPAARSGIRQGDVVLAMDGHVIAAPRDLTRVVADSKAGSQAALTVWRSNREVPLKIAIGAMPDTGKTLAANSTDRRGSSAKSANDGSIDLAALGLRLGQAQTSGTGKRVVVTAVNDEADAAEKGIRPGDYILKVNGFDVASPSEVAKALAQAQSDRRSSVLLLIENQEGQRFIPVKVASA